MLAAWWADKYRLPPNHPLFLGETMAYWKQWFYMDALRRRDALRREADRVRTTQPEGREHAAALRNTLTDLVERINVVNDLMSEEHDEAAPGDREAQEAAARGEVPEGLRNVSVAQAKAMLAARLATRGPAAPR